MKRQIDDWTSRLADNESASAAVAAAAAVREQLEAVEPQLVQPELTADGDSLNYREMLFEKLNDLPPVVSSADARPTAQSYAVYAKLAGQADEQLAALDTLLTGDLASLNGKLTDLGVGIIGV